MRILAITAGAGPMYCGSCLRDNALAAELIRRRHDVTLLPVYTPTTTDEPNVSERRVLLGGISVYLEQRLPIFRRLPKVLDRLWDAPAVLRAASRRSIRTDPKMLGELTVSMLRGEAGPQRKEVEKLLEWIGDEPAPDITILPNSLLIGLAAPIARATGRPVGVTLQGEDLFIAGLGEPWRSETVDLIRRQAQHADAFFAVSEFYAGSMSAYLAIPKAKMHVLPLGVNVAGLEPRAARPDRPAPRVGFFGRIAPEKGLHVLCEAWRRLRARPGAPPATLEAAGYLAPEHRRYFQDIEAKVRSGNLANDFRYHGSLDRAAKAEFLRGLDVFSLPATYDEPKGLSVLEAMACGVPVIQPRRGAFPEILQKAGGGLLVAPDDPNALAGALNDLLVHPARAASLGAAGAQGVRQHYTVGRMADRALEVYAAIAGRGAGRSAAAC
jgi:glycosyltransferase involved in cell wall biosynthesis